MRALRTLALLLPLVAGVARADDAHDPDREAARRHFQAGLEAYNANDYARALQSFEAAARLQPHSAFDYNIARCYDRLEQYPQALYYYQRYVAASPNSADAPTIYERIKVLSERVVSAPPPGMQQPVGMPPLPPPQRTLVRLESSNPRTSLLRVDTVMPSVYPYSRVTPSIEQTEVKECEVPCGIEVNTFGSYRIGGEQVTRSKAFGLPQGTKSVTIEVKAGVRPKQKAGMVLTYIGLVPLSIGPLLLIGASGGEDAGLWATGAIFTGLGIAMLSVGLVYWLGNKTTVSVKNDPPVAPLSRLRLPGGLALSPQGLHF